MGNRGKIHLTPFSAIFALHDVLGNAGEIGARQAGHTDSLLEPRASGDQRNPRERIRNCP